MLMLVLVVPLQSQLERVETMIPILPLMEVAVETLP